LAGRVPTELAEQFAADTFELKTHELSDKYDIAISTVKDWRLDCKMRLSMATGYGTGSSTVTNAVIKGVTSDDEQLDPEQL
jgi:hypothetical protein